MSGPRVTKISLLRAAMDAGDWRKAISIAAKFGELGAADHAVRAAQSAINNPAFFRQIKKDPEAMVEEAKRALIERYGNEK